MTGMVLVERVWSRSHLRGPFWGLVSSNLADLFLSKFMNLFLTPFYCIIDNYCFLLSSQRLIDSVQIAPVRNHQAAAIVNGKSQ